MDLDHEVMWEAVRMARLSTAEDDAARHPKVGAALRLANGQIVTSHKGELRVGDHAEYTLLEGKLPDEDLHGSTIYTTLEPCTHRSEKKTPCANRIIDRGVSAVVVGMIDPDPVISGAGVRRLRDHGISVSYFTQEAETQLRTLNGPFIEVKCNSSDPLGLREPNQRSLDDWYHSINAIYLDKNFSTSLEIIYTHLVESGQSLAKYVASPNRQFDGVNSRLAKIFAWWLALCGKAAIRSVEEVVWTKYPGVCPYCRTNPHVPTGCKKTFDESPDWTELVNISERHHQSRPASLGGWQDFFVAIYAPGALEQAVEHLSEEIQELAAGIRLFRVAPWHLLAEIADVFAWLMHAVSANENEQKKREKQLTTFAEFAFRVYPDACFECERAVCACPAILPRSVARITGQGPVAFAGQAFMAPQEVLIQFDIGSREILIAGEAFDASESGFVHEVYKAANHVVREMHSIQVPEHELVPLERVFQVMLKLATSQRVNQAAIESLLAITDRLDQDQRTGLAHLIDQSGFSKWHRALSRAINPPSTSSNPA